jgi:repressor LexA
MDNENKVHSSSDLREQARRPHESEGRMTHPRESNNLRTEILHAIEDYWREHGRPPTIREIGSLVGITSCGYVAHHVAMLERQGLLSREPGRSRGLRVLGTIAAGDPLEQFGSGESELLELDELATANPPFQQARDVRRMRCGCTVRQ